MELYCDYPLWEREGEFFPVRKVMLRRFDGNKYCKVADNEGVLFDVKYGYLFHDNELQNQVTIKELEPYV